MTATGAGDAGRTALEAGAGGENEILKPGLNALAAGFNESFLRLARRGRSSRRRRCRRRTEQPRQEVRPPTAEEQQRQEENHSRLHFAQMRRHVHTRRRRRRRRRRGSGLMRRGRRSGRMHSRIAVFLVCLIKQLVLSALFGLMQRLGRLALDFGGKTSCARLMAL
jgi:hypothetical protein